MIVVEVPEQASRGNVQLPGFRVVDGTRCALLATQRVDGSWLIEIKGVEESGVRVSGRDLAVFGEAVAGKARREYSDG